MALLLAPLAYVAAQNPVKPPKPNPDAQSQPAPTQQPAPTAPPTQAPANRPERIRRGRAMYRRVSR